MGERFTDGGYEIDFAEAVYDELDIPCMFPPSIKELMETVVARSRIPSEFIDYRSATDEFIRRAKTLMERVGWKLTDDGETVYKETPLDGKDDLPRAKNMIVRIANMDIIAIVNAYRDDGWVMMPDGTLYQPIHWAELMGKMDQRIREQLYWQGGCISHQEFVDRYAEEHKKMFGEVWGPYRTDEDKKKEDES